MDQEARFEQRDDGAGEKCKSKYGNGKRDPTLPSEHCRSEAQGEAQKRTADPCGDVDFTQPVERRADALNTEFFAAATPSIGPR